MAKFKGSIIDLYDLESPYVTEFSRLLHRVLDKPGSNEMKTMMITSSMVSEGKSTVCSILGISAALKKGLKTLIFDTDLRRPSINRLFNIPQSPGLVEILREGYNPKDAIIKTSINKLDIIPSGEVVENPTEIFDAELIGTIIDDLKFYYDLILLDCAPLLPVSDPMLLAPKVDGILLVVKAGSTSRDIVKRGVEILKNDRERIIGVAMNNVTNTLPYYYDYSYYHYDYRPSGSTRRKKKRNPQAPSGGGTPIKKHSPQEKNKIGPKK